MAATYPSLLVAMVTGKDHPHQTRRYFMYGLVVHSGKIIEQAFVESNSLIHHPPTENTAGGTQRKPEATLYRYKSYAFMENGSGTNPLS